MDEEARLLFFDAVQTGLRTGGKGNTLSDYALTTSSTSALQAALIQSAGFQEQKKWEASLKVCQMAERYLAYIGAQPAYYNELGYAYWNLKRLKEAYQAFVKGEETAKKALASPNLPQDARSMYTELQTEFHQNAEKLKSHA